MEDFKRELKNKCDSDFEVIKNNNKPKKGKKGTVTNVKFALASYTTLLEKTSEMIMDNTNEIYPKKDVSKEQALNEARSLIKEYLPKIKKHSGL